MVIDTLNFQKQMPNQLKSFNGKYSEMIHDYEERNLLPLPDTADARKLWAMVDPWVYREQADPAQDAHSRHQRSLLGTGCDECVLG